MNPHPPLVLDDVAKRFGTTHAVAGVSLTLAPGEIVALVGQSGSGKSTLLRLIAGLERPSAGRITIAGRVMSDVGLVVPPESRGIGMVFQDYALFPHLTVLDNVRFGLTALSRREALARATTALARIGLATRAAAYPHALSGGQQQRVALARALVPRPSLLLMDEPFSNLDRRTQATIREETAGLLAESGTAAILVTHEPEDAMRMAARILLIQAGRIVQAGTAEELHRRPASLLTARFFGDFNEIEAVCRGGAVDTPFGRFAAPGIADGAEAALCIRPRDLRVAVPGALTGTVTASAYVGGEILLSVAVPGLKTSLQLRVPCEERATPGDTIGLAIDPADVLILPRDG
jgi:iron(III) transport system ATP-binding protein